MIDIVKQVCNAKAGCDVDSDTGWAPATEVKKGATATFRITVTNTGNVTLAPIQVSDPIAADCERVVTSLDPGQSVHYTCTMTGLTKAVTNVATATGQGVDPNGTPVGDPVTDTDTAKVTIDGDGLAYTGVELEPMLWLAGVLALLGIGGVAVARRRRNA